MNDFADIIKENENLLLDSGQIEAYLKRIGVSACTVDAECLEKLTWANLTKVPFENLLITEENRVPELSVDALFEKIVEHRRGGYCFELNKLFYCLLKSAGFELIPVAVRILYNKPDVPATTHRASVVYIGGKRYLTDVGYGGPGPKGILELTEGVHFVRGIQFGVNRTEDGSWLITRGAEEKPLFLFEGKRAREVDFELMNFYCARCEKVIFTQTQVLNLCTENGSIALTGMHLTIHEGEKVIEKELESGEEFRKTLEEQFGIRLS